MSKTRLVRPCMGKAFISTIGNMWRSLTWFWPESETRWADIDKIRALFQQQADLAMSQQMQAQLSPFNEDKPASLMFGNGRPLEEIIATSNRIKRIVGLKRAGRPRPVISRGYGNG